MSGSGAASQYTPIRPSGNVSSSGSSLTHAPEKLKSHPGPDQQAVIRRNDPKSMTNSNRPSRIRFASTTQKPSASQPLVASPSQRPVTEGGRPPLAIAFGPGYAPT